VAKPLRNAYHRPWLGLDRSASLRREVVCEALHESNVVPQKRQKTSQNIIKERALPCSSVCRKLYDIERRGCAVLAPEFGVWNIRASVRSAHNGLRQVRLFVVAMVSKSRPQKAGMDRLSSCRRTNVAEKYIAANLIDGEKRTVGCAGLRTQSGIFGAPPRRRAKASGGRTVH